MMGERIVEFLLHVDQPLARDQQRQFEDRVRQQPCVVGAGVSPQHPHLMMIAYDADCGRASDIVMTIQSEGYRVEAIGI